MEKADKELLVTYDFTPVSDNALAHALRISKYTDSPSGCCMWWKRVQTLRTEKEEAENKLKLVCEDFMKKWTESGYVILGYHFQYHR
jgi:hypothetical protein